MAGAAIVVSHGLAAAGLSLEIGSGACDGSEPGTKVQEGVEMKSKRVRQRVLRL